MLQHSIITKHISMSKITNLYLTILLKIHTKLLIIVLSTNRGNFLLQRLNTNGQSRYSISVPYLEMVCPRLIKIDKNASNKITWSHGH